MWALFCTFHVSMLPATGYNILQIDSQRSSGFFFFFCNLPILQKASPAVWFAKDTGDFSHWQVGGFNVRWRGLYLKFS